MAFHDDGLDTICLSVFDDLFDLVAENEIDLDIDNETLPLPPVSTVQYVVDSIPAQGNARLAFEGKYFIPETMYTQVGKKVKMFLTGYETDSPELSLQITASVDGDPQCLREKGLGSRASIETQQAKDLKTWDSATSPTVPHHLTRNRDTMEWSSYIQFTHISHYTDVKKPSSGLFTLTFTVKDGDIFVASLTTKPIAIIRKLTKTARDAAAPQSHGVHTQPGVYSQQGVATQEGVATEPYRTSPSPSVDASVDANNSPSSTRSLSTSTPSISSATTSTRSTASSRPQDTEVATKAFEISTFLMAFGLCPKQNAITKASPQWSVTLLSFLRAVGHHLSSCEASAAHNDSPSLLAATVQELVLARSSVHGIQNAADVERTIESVKEQLDRGESPDETIPVLDWFIDAVVDLDLEDVENNAKMSDSLQQLVTYMNSFCKLSDNKAKRKDIVN